MANNSERGVTWDGTLSNPQFNRAMESVQTRTAALITEARSMQVEAPTRPNGRTEAGIVFSDAERHAISKDARRATGRGPVRRAR